MIGNVLITMWNSSIVFIQISLITVYIYVIKFHDLHQYLVQIAELDCFFNILIYAKQILHSCSCSSAYTVYWNWIVIVILEFAFKHYLICDRWTICLEGLQTDCSSDCQIDHSWRCRTQMAAKRRAEKNSAIDHGNQARTSLLCRNFE